MRTFITLLIPIAVIILGAFTHGEHNSQELNRVEVQMALDTFDQAQAIADLKASIAGRENEPASEVFDNIEMFGQMPAGRIIGVMEMGFSRSLGVNCTHCHNPKDWGSEEKPTKQVAREMMAMSQKINGELLTAIPNLQSTQAVVNCTTCHRGEIKPATNLGE